MKHGWRQGGEKAPGVARRGHNKPSSAVPPAHAFALDAMQRVHGNRFVASVLGIQRKCECGGTCSKCSSVQRKGGRAPGPITPGLSSYLANPGGGEPLRSAPGVRIHNDSRAHAAAQHLDARALTVGSNIFFSAGRYQPGTAAGHELLSHELAHVAQQRNGAVGGGLMEDAALEKEADDVAAGRASNVHSLGRTGIQRQPEDKDTSKTKKKKKKDDEDDKDTSVAPAKKEPPAELRWLDLLPPSLRPELPPESDSERLQRMLSDDLKAADRTKGITHLQNPPGPTTSGAGPTTKPSGGAKPEAEPSSVSATELAEAARALLQRCNRDQYAQGDPNRPPQPEEKAPLEPQDPGSRLKKAVEVCLDTPEGEGFKKKAKGYLLSKQGAPVTVGAVGALLTNFALTGNIAYIPAIPLGEGAELKLEINGPVNKPEQAMITLKVSDFSSFGATLWKGLQAVGRGFAAVGKGLATLGGWIWKGISTFAGWVWTGLKWLARQIFDKIAGTLGRVVQWMLKLPFRIARLLKTLIEGVAAVRPWSLHFWESLGRVGTWVDFLKWLGTVGLELAEIAGLGELYETVADIIKFNTRSLRNDEREAAGKVFGSSVPYHLVRIDEAAVFGPASTKREYTSFHLINGWGGIAPDTLIHELTHVWQYENAGAIYMPQALHAQATAGYDYGGLPGLQAARTARLGILSFNREQQAQIVQDFFRIAQGSAPMMSAGSKSDQGLYAYFVKDVSTHQEAYLASLRF